MSLQSFLLDLAIGPIYGVKPPTPQSVQSYIEHRDRMQPQGEKSSLRLRAQLDRFTHLMEHSISPHHVH